MNQTPTSTGGRANLLIIRTNILTSGHVASVRDVDSGRQMIAKLSTSPGCKHHAVRKGLDARSIRTDETSAPWTGGLPS